MLTGKKKLLSNDPLIEKLSRQVQAMELKGQYDTSYHQHLQQLLDEKEPADVAVPIVEHEENKQ